MRVLCAGTVHWDLHTVQERCILLAMDIDSPATVPGSVLAAERVTYGVKRTRLAQKLGLHRNTLRDWEMADEVDVIRQRRYRSALRDLVEEAVA